MKSSFFLHIFIEHFPQPATISGLSSSHFSTHKHTHTHTHTYTHTHTKLGLRPRNGKAARRRLLQKIWRPGPKESEGSVWASCRHQKVEHDGKDCAHSLTDSFSHCPFTPPLLISRSYPHPHPRPTSHHPLSFLASFPLLTPCLPTQPTPSTQPPGHALPPPPRAD